MRVEILSVWDRYRFFASNTEEPDVIYLWPGLRQALADKYRSPKRFVIGGVSSESRIVCRAIFTQSLTHAKVWHYGYLYTNPRVRQHGFARQVLLSGLQVVRRLGGLYSDCYVARTNIGSMALNEKIGYRRLPFVRLHGAQSRSPHGRKFAVQDVAESDIRHSEAGRRLLGDVAGPQWLDVLSEEFLCRSSALPWRQRPTVLVRVTEDGAIIGFARCGQGYANILLDHQAVPTTMLKQTCAAIESSLSDSRRALRSFFFVREDELRRASDAPTDSSYDYVYMHDRVGTL